MSWNYGEIVRCGNSTAKVKNYYPETGLLVLNGIEGSFEEGDTIVGDESGMTLTFTNFTVSFEYDMGYEPTYWIEVLDTAIYDGDGNLVGLEAYFTGKPNQDNQITYLVVTD